MPMQYPELTLANLTTHHIENHLDDVRQMVETIPELAAQWADLSESEQLHFRLELTRVFGLRRLLGAAYQASQLTTDQIARLAHADHQLLEQAADVEIVCGSTLRQLAHDLFAWGTPLAQQSGRLRVETTLTALAELAVA